MTELNPAGISAEQLNQTIAYTQYAVYTRHGGAGADAADPQTQLDRWVEKWTGRGVTVRGLYDASGFKADSDVIVWTHCPDMATLQAAHVAFRRLPAAGALTLAWSAVGVHREAEFAKSHGPAFMYGKQPRTWLTVYPFVRSYEWYLLPDDQRREMLLEHGKKGRQYPQVNANTVAAFALGDYEWLLAFEADELTDLVDMMRDLRYTEARRHVRDELPFYTGRRITTAQLAVLLA